MDDRVKDNVYDGFVKQEPKIKIASDTKTETERKARFEGGVYHNLKDEEVDMARYEGYDSDNTYSSFHESEYDMQDDDVFEVNVNLGI